LSCANTLSQRPQGWCLRRCRSLHRHLPCLWHPQSLQGRSPGKDWASLSPSNEPTNTNDSKQIPIIGPKFVQPELPASDNVSTYICTRVFFLWENQADQFKAVLSSPTVGERQLHHVLFIGESERKGGSGIETPAGYQTACIPKAFYAYHRIHSSEHLSSVFVNCYSCCCSMSILSSCS